MTSHYFLGIKVSPVITSELLHWQQILKESMSYKDWTDPEDFHITLKFLGGCSDEKIEAYRYHLSRYRWSDEFSIQIGPAGYFGHLQQPRVFHADVVADQALFDMKRGIEHVGKEMGFEIEQRPFHPHVTLAKKQAMGISPLSKTTYDQNFDQQFNMLVDHFSLFKIHPHQTPKYECVAEIRFSSEV